MNIPDKAYEAAREALVKRGLLAVGDAAEIALEAAAPFIAAQALRCEATRADFRGSLYSTYGRDRMRERADELDPQ